VAAARVLEMEDARRAALVNLSGMVGMEVTNLDKLRADFKVRPIDTATFEEWKKQALDANPVIRSERIQVDIVHEEFNKARAGHYPRVDFVANYAKNDSDTLNTLDQRSTVRSVGVQVSIPLFSGGSVSAATRQAKDNELRAQAEMQAKTDQIMVELRKAYDGVVSGVAHIAALEKAVASGELLTKATTKSIKGGVRINLDLLNAQEQLYTARRDLAQARYTYLLATLRMRAAAGKLSAADVHDVATYFHGT
jgi:protease secretion system outer membrane protein